LNKTTLIILLQFVVILLLIWFLWLPTDNNTTNRISPESSKVFKDDAYGRLLTRLDNLENELSQETTGRQQLEDRITKLENRSPASTENGHTEKTSESDTQAVYIGQETDDIPIQQKLINQGVAAQTANMLQRFIDDKRLQQLNLRDQAIREGWQNSDKFAERMNALGDTASGLKQEFGEQVYDQYLYATGRPNRVIVREIINGSVAQSAGLQAGDIIIRYANETIYSMNDLRQATTKGTSGENILLEFMRDNQPYSTTIVRGPLGISMDFAHIAP
jgi:hypothetical protein